MNTGTKKPFILEATAPSGQLLLGAARHGVGKEVPLHSLAVSRSLIRRDVLKPYIDIRIDIQCSFNWRREQEGLQEEDHELK